eukprot:scaffold49461_cov45-Phaeocystis_antarctica.AAC.1
MQSARCAAGVRPSATSPEAVRRVEHLGPAALCDGGCNHRSPGCNPIVSAPVQAVRRVEHLRVPCVPEAREEAVRLVRGRVRVRVGFGLGSGLGLGSGSGSGSGSGVREEAVRLVRPDARHGQQPCHSKARCPARSAALVSSELSLRVTTCVPAPLSTTSSDASACTSEKVDVGREAPGCSPVAPCTSTLETASVDEPGVPCASALAAASGETSGTSALAAAAGEPSGASSLSVPSSRCTSSALRPLTFRPAARSRCLSCGTVSWPRSSTHARDAGCRRGREARASANGETAASARPLPRPRPESPPAPR